MDPQALSLLFSSAQQGNPVAQQALTNAKEQITPPPTDAQMTVGPSTPPPQAQPMGSPIATQLSPESLAKADQGGATGTPTTGAPTSGLTSIGMPTGGKGPPSFGRQAVGHTVGFLLGSGLARLFGGKGAATKFASGYAGVAVPDLQRKQQEDSARGQKIWADQWEAAQALPSEVLTDPKFAELRDAVLAMQKDMENGNVANPKTAANFMMAQAKFKNELDQIKVRMGIDQEIQRANLLADAQHKNNMKKIEEALQTVNDKSGLIPQEQKMAAAAFLQKAPRPREVTDPETGQKITMFLTDEDYQQWGFRVQELANKKRELELKDQDRASDADYRRRSLGLQEKELGIREKEADARLGVVDSRRRATAALGQLNASLKNTVAAMDNDPNSTLTPQQKQTAAFQKIMGDSVMQRTLLDAAGVQYGKMADGTPAVLLNGKPYAFSSNPAANLKLMEAVYGQVMSASRLGEME
jgi:hypothetical protein